MYAISPFRARSRIPEMAAQFQASVCVEFINPVKFITGVRVAW
ncbi:hypothetical protein SAMN06297164_2060 [Nitrosomonas ureae]|uniref:Uncharacterized protein n=1 Tax=Nitrosomonas ureae TaxID=44577 RepID=A0A286AB34_9PROT|nr:hypothetical protein SAMN06297164_2060 [Nitrosomonas ureae]